MELIEAFKSIHHLTSSRLEFIGQNRYCNHVQFFSGPSYMLCGQRVHDLHTLTEVARSSTQRFRQVKGQFIVCDRTNTVLWIIEMICLIARGVIDAQGNVSSGAVDDSYKACRGSLGECGHTLADLLFIHEGGINVSSTSGARQWGVPKSRKRESNHALVKSVNPATHIFDNECRLIYNPIRLQHRNEIERGLASPLYRGKLLEFILVKKREIDLYASSSEHVGRDLKIETLNLDKRGVSALKIQQAADAKAAYVAGALKSLNIQQAALAAAPAASGIASPAAAAVHAFAAATASASGIASPAAAAAAVHAFAAGASASGISSPDAAAVHAFAAASALGIASPAAAAVPAAAGTAYMDGAPETTANRVVRAAKAKAAFISTLPINVSTKEAVMQSEVSNIAVHLRAAADAHATVLQATNLPAARITDKVSMCLPGTRARGRPRKRTRCEKISIPDQQELTCICPLKCKGQTHNFLLLPKHSKYNSRRSEFVTALGLPCAAINTSGKFYVHAGHFEIYMFSIGKNGNKYLNVTGAPNAMIVNSFDTHDDLLHAIRARETASEIKNLKSARTKLCICFAGAACSDDLSLRPSNRLPLNKSLSAIWLKVICPDPTAAQRRRLKNSKNLRLDRRHFRYDQLICVGDSERVTVRPGCVPSRLHVPFEYQWSDTHNLAAMVPITEVKKIHDRTSCVDLYDMGNLRKAVFDIQQAGRNLSFGVSILQEFVQERVQLALISATSAAVMNVEPPALPPVHVNVVLGFVQDDPHYCRTHTGEPSWISILAQFKYIDADNAISSMHVTFTRRPDKSKLTAETDTSKVASMRKRTLISPLHQFAVFLLMAKSFLSDVETLAKSFNITERIAFRYYDAHCAAFSYLQLYHQPVPTYGEMVVATPTIMRNVAVSHGAPPGSAVIASDCSEVKLNRAENVEVFTVTYSTYKGGNTVKVPTFALGTGYLFPLTLTGPCDDDEVLKASGIASILFQAMETARTGVGVDREADILISMLYDKGLSNWTFLEKMGIYVLCPDKAKPKQMVFGQKSSRTCRELASGRIIIENVHAVLKEYAAFANTKRLDRLDMTLHEFNAVRFLINTQPVINNWTSLSQHSIERDTDAVLHRPDLPMGKCGCALCKSKKSS